MELEELLGILEDFIEEKVTVGKYAQAAKSVAGSRWNKYLETREKGNSEATDKAARRWIKAEQAQHLNPKSAVSVGKLKQAAKASIPARREEASKKFKEAPKEETGLIKKETPEREEFHRARKRMEKAEDIASGTIRESMGEKARNSAFQDELARNSAHDNYMEALRMYNDKKDEVSRQRAEKARQEYVKKQEAFDKSSKNADALMKAEDKLRQKRKLSEGILLDQRPDASIIFREPAVSSVIDKTKETIKKHKSAREKENERLKSIDNAQRLKQEKEKATKEYNNSVKQYIKAGKVAKGLPQTAKQVRANTQLNISKKNLEDATKAHAEAKRTHLKRKLQGDFNSLQGATETMKVLIEELGTSIGAMMDVQPINLAGKEMPSKQNRHKEKKADYRYKYRKSRSKSIVEEYKIMELQEIYEMLLEEGIQEEVAYRACELISEGDNLRDTVRKMTNNPKYTVSKGEDLERRALKVKGTNDFYNKNGEHEMSGDPSKDIPKYSLGEFKTDVRRRKGHEINNSNDDATLVNKSIKRHNKKVAAKAHESLQESVSEVTYNDIMSMVEKFTNEIIEAEIPAFMETAEDKQRKANNQKYMDNLKAKEARKEQDKKNMRNAVINLRRSVRGQKPLSEDTVEDIMNMVEDLVSTAKKTGDEKLVSKAREVRDNERKRHNDELFHKWTKGESRYNNVDGRYETKNEKGERETRLNSHQYDKNGFKKYNDEKALVNKSIERHNKKENK